MYYFKAVFYGKYGLVDFENNYKSTISTKSKLEKYFNSCFHLVAYIRI